MKFFKKAVSALLASVMCIPSGILSFAEAAEETTVTTVTLSDTENGFMQFSEDSMESSTASQDGYHMVQVGDDGELEQVENDGSMWAFNSGDFVEIELIPDNGYNVKSFAIKDSASGETMASKETMDNIFSFTMPSNSVTVEAVFSDSSTVEVVPEDETENDPGKDVDPGSADGLDMQSRYHDITESPEVSEAEVNEVIFDLATESYIKANVNPEYVKLDGTNEAVDVLHVKQTLFDGRYVEEDDSIYSIMHSIEYGDADMEKNILKLLGQTQGVVYIYDYSAGGDYYVAYADTMHKDACSTVRDWKAAYNNKHGMSVDGCIYDDETGLLYIPKRLYDDMEDLFYAEGDDGETMEVSTEEGTVIGNLQVQFMQVCFNGGSSKNGRTSGSGTAAGEMQDLDSQVSTVSISEDGGSIDVSNGSADIFANETTTYVDAGMDEDNLEVSVNGAPVDERLYQYDADTGKLVIEQSSSVIISVEASEKEEGVKDQLRDMIADKAKAIAYDDMTSVTKTPVEISDPKKMPDKGNEKCFEPFKVIGKIRVGGAAYRKANPSENNPPYYVPGKTNKVHGQLADYARGYSNTKPASSGYVLAKEFGTLNHVSTLSSAKAGSGDSWANSYSYLSLIRKFGTHATPCAHIDWPDYGLQTSHPSKNYTSNQDAATFSVRAVYIKNPKKTVTEKNEDGYKITTTKYTGGYAVFAVASICLCTQTSCFLFKVPFKCETEEKKTDDQPDPLYLAVVKDGNNLAATSDGTTLGSSKLHNAVFACDFYDGESGYKDAKSLTNDRDAGKVTPTCHWEFKAYASTKWGSKQFADTFEKATHNFGVKDEDEELMFTPAGIDFGPKQAKYNKIPRSEWKNEYITSGLSSWKKNFGKKGIYHIYEIKEPEGFRLTGYMFDASNVDNKTNGVADENGVVVYMDSDITTGKTTTYINGQKSTNKLITAGQESTAKAPAGAVLYTRDKIDDMKVKTEASPHEAEPDSGEITVSDSLTVYPFMTRQDLNYAVTVTLVDITDKDQGEYVNAVWDTSKGGDYQPQVDGSEDVYFIPSSITHVIRAEDIDWSDVDFGSDYESDKKMIPIDVSCTIDTTGLSGHTLVFVVTMDAYTDDGTSVSGDESDESGVLGSYTSSQDETSEQIVFRNSPEMGLQTSMSAGGANRKSGTGEVIALQGKSQSFTDTIQYSGLAVGKKYKVKSWLVDTATGDKAKDKNRQTIEYSGTHTADSKKSWDVKFTFDTTGMEGKKLVAYTEVYAENGTVPLFSSKDNAGWLNDRHETIMIPSVSTELMDNNTAGHSSSSGKSKFTDYINYTNFVPGAKVKIVTSVVDCKTGATVFNRTSYDIADKERGSFSVPISLTIPADSEQEYVAFEEIYIEKDQQGSGQWVLVASHKDPDDDNQKIFSSTLKTYAFDQKTNYNLSYAEKYVRLFDVVHYDNLEPNAEYIIVSRLVDKATGQTAVDDNGEELSMELKFVAKENIELGQYIDNKPYKGDLYSDLDGKLSGVVNEDGKFSGKFTGNVTYVKEGRAYGDIIPGNHENGGVGFVLNAESFAGRTLVFFEELYKMENGSMSLIASETNRSDANQTIRFPKIRTSAIDVATNSNVSLSGEDIVDLDGVQVAVENNLYNESQSIHLPAATTLEADNENGLHFTRAESKWFCDNDSCVTYTCNGCGEQFHSEDEAKKHLPDCWNRESDGYTCTGGCFDAKAEAEQHTAPVYECDNCGLHFSDKEDAEAHVNGACKDAAVLRATQLVRDADGNVVNELWYACSGLNGLEFAGGRFQSFFCRKISLPHML